MKEEINSPAKRLLDLLHELDTSGQPAQDTVFNRFLVAFEVLGDEEQFDNVLELLRKSKQLVGQYESAITRLGDDHDLFSEPVLPLRNLFSSNRMNDSYPHARARISLDLITTLKFAHRGLERIGYEKQVSPDHLHEITELINELESVVLNSEFPPELKKALNDQIVLFRQALADYRILGADAFKQAVEASIGKIVVNQSVLREPEASPARQKLHKIMSRMTEAANWVSKNSELISNVVKLLGSGSNDN